MFNSTDAKRDSSSGIAGSFGFKGLFRVRILIVSFSVLAAVSAARAQISPAIGPDSYRSDVKQLGTGILTGMVKSTAEQAVADANTMLKNQGSSIRVQLLPFKFWSPSRFQTQYTNRPNEWYIKIPTMIGINIDIPVVADRQIYYPLDLNITCDKWFTGSGVVKVIAQPGPPSVEGGSIIEDVVHIRDFIDSQVRSHLPGIAAVTQTIPNSQCVTLGASPSSGTSDPFSFIAWDPPGRRIIGGAVAALPRLEVTFTKLKRLQARGNGALLYSPTENIRLDLFANMAQLQTPVLTMKEGDEVPLNVRPVVVSPLLDMLVIVVNANQEPLGSLQDSAFASALKSANYSGGTHTLQIPKHYIIPPGPMNRKPIIATVPAYELTYVVKYATATMTMQ